MSFKLPKPRLLEIDELDPSGFGRSILGRERQLDQMRLAHKIEMDSYVLLPLDKRWKNPWVEAVLTWLGPSASRTVTGFCYPIPAIRQRRMAIFSKVPLDQARLRSIDGVYNVSAGWQVKGAASEHGERSVYHKIYLWTNWNRGSLEKAPNRRSDPYENQVEPFIGTKDEYPEWCAEQRRMYGED